MRRGTRPYPLTIAGPSMPSGVQGAEGDRMRRGSTCLQGPTGQGPRGDRCGDVSRSGESLSFPPHWCNPTAWSPEGDIWCWSLVPIQEAGISARILHQGSIHGLVCLWRYCREGLRRLFSAGWRNLLSPVEPSSLRFLPGRLREGERPVRRRGLGAACKASLGLMPPFF